MVRTQVERLQAQLDMENGKPQGERDEVHIGKLKDLLELLKSLDEACAQIDQQKFCKESHTLKSISYFVS